MVVPTTEGAKDVDILGRLTEDCFWKVLVVQRHQSFDPNGYNVLAVLIQDGKRKVVGNAPVRELGARSEFNGKFELR